MIANYESVEMEEIDFRGDTVHAAMRAEVANGKDDRAGEELRGERLELLRGVVSMLAISSVDEEIRTRGALGELSSRCKPD